MNIAQALLEFWTATGIVNMTWQQGVMILVGLVLIYLAVAKEFEPLLLVPIGFGGILANVPFPPGIMSNVGHTISTLVGGVVQVEEFGGFLSQLADMGIQTGLFPLLIFMGVGAMTDFGPLLANPRLALLGAAAQFGIFATLLGALGLASAGLVDFSLADAAAIGIIGGADGPTAIFVAEPDRPGMSHTVWLVASMARCSS